MSKPNLKIPKQYYFKTQKEAEKYTITEKHVVTEFDVSLNELYKQMNPNLEIPKVDEEIEVKFIPFAYFRYKGKVWPIYDDDPGQQDCIYIDGKWIGAGSWTSYPYSVEYFCYYIDNLNKKKKEN